ncbi:MAG: hypothetical protein RLZZ156_2892 [Deinococcota bacterium]
MKILNRRQALQNLGMFGVGAAMSACVTPVIAQQPDIDLVPRLIKERLV